MNSYFWSKFFPLWSHVPIISQSICYISPTMRNICIADRIGVKIKWFDSNFHLMIPKMHCSICSTCCKPILLIWMKIDRIYRIKCYRISLLYLMTLKCYMAFLKIKIKKLPNCNRVLVVMWYSKDWLYHQLFLIPCIYHFCLFELPESVNIFLIMLNRIISFCAWL